MITTYIFNEPGSVPGIPGLFSSCQVIVKEDGSFDIQPLARHPHFVASPEEAEEAPPQTEKEMEE